MTSFLFQLLPAAIFLLSLSVPLGIALWIRHQRKHRRNPITSQMLRAPGESISKRIDQLNGEIDQYLTFTSIVPLLNYSGFLTTRYIANAQVSPVIFLLLALGFTAFFGVRLKNSLRQRHNEQLGLDCEQAIGQELNQLMLLGYRVYHDFPAENFNIDHIVIGTNGVFAIETKGRAKPKDIRDNNWSVVFDGQNLQFPTWTEREYLPQARRQAQWFSKWLSSAVGEPVSVKPALAIAGWNIELKKPSDVIIFSGKNPQFFPKINTNITLSSTMIQRIAHQIEQRCRDVEPLAYKSN